MLPVGTYSVPPVLTSWNVVFPIVGAVEAREVIVSRLLQFLKALLPMVFTLAPIVTDVSPVHSKKALPPIVKILFGMTIEVRPMQELNAFSPMVGISFGIIVFLQANMRLAVCVSIIALQLYLESYTVFPLSTLIDSTPVQPLKAPLPIDVTLRGIFIEDRLVQLWKAALPIDVTVFGIVTEVRPLQPPKAPLAIDVTVFGIVTEVIAVVL